METSFQNVYSNTALLIQKVELIFGVFYPQFMNVLLRRNVVSVHEMSSNGVYASNCVETMVAEYHAIARLYQLVHRFAQRYNSPSTAGMCDTSGIVGCSRMADKIIKYNIMHQIEHQMICPLCIADTGIGLQGCGHGGVCPPLSEMVRVRSYNYKQISVSYGPGYTAYCVVKYNTQDKVFGLDFGECGLFIIVISFLLNNHLVMM